MSAGDLTLAHGDFELAHREYALSAQFAPDLVEI